MSPLTPIHLPSLGEGVFEATLQSWLKQPGERLEKGEGFCVVSTDKVDTEIPSPVTGYFHQPYVSEGSTVTVGVVLAAVSSQPASQQDQATPPSKPSSSSAPQVPADAAHPASKVASLPPVFHGLYAAPKSATAMAPQPPLSHTLHTQHTQPSLPGKGPLLETYQKAEEEFLEGVPVQRVPLARFHRRMAERTRDSLVVSPHATSSMEMPLCAIASWRARYRQAQGTSPPSLTVFFLRALAQCLPQHPLFLASVDGDDLLMKNEVHLGVAVASKQGGIIIPVIRHATQLDLFALSDQLTALVSKAHQGSLRPEEVRGGTFTLTNPGMFGCRHSTAIIHQPQVAIMNVGGVHRWWEPEYQAGDGDHNEHEQAMGDFLPVERIKGWRRKSSLTFSLTFDHRILGGKEAGLFLSDLKAFFDKPELPVVRALAGGQVVSKRPG